MADSILPTISTNSDFVRSSNVDIKQHKMKPTEINLTIAKLCGWRVVSSLEYGLYWLETLSGSTNGYKQGISEDHAWAVCCPNYHGSLDACSEFEKVLTLSQEDEYGFNLRNVIGNKVIGASHGGGPYNLVTDEGLCRCAIATAPQRCEAFLRMHGKWMLG